MKAFITFMLISFKIFASTSSINPERLVTPLLDIFSENHRIINDQIMEVRVSPYSKSGSINKGKDKIQMPTESYLRALKLSRAVYRMIPNESSAEQTDGQFHMGTAFHIGENLVLTNHHVLSPSRVNTTDCGGFQLHGNTNSDVFTCRKVHYCNNEHDVCLIEMNPAKRCKNFLCTKSETIQLKDGESLRLKASPQIDYTRMNDIIMSCIGNTMGLGIHFSQGRGLHIVNDKTYFYAPLRTGNSGGPLIGEDGLGWGVVKLESGEKVGSGAYNIAASIEKVIALMREQLSNDKITLEKFNRSIID